MCVFWNLFNSVFVIDTPLIKTLDLEVITGVILNRIVDLASSVNAKLPSAQVLQATKPTTAFISFFQPHIFTAQQALWGGCVRLSSTALGVEQPYSNEEQRLRKYCQTVPGDIYMSSTT